MNFTLFGSETLTLRCAEMLLEAGHRIVALVTASPACAAWAEARGIPGTPAACDWILSLAHLSIIPPEVLALAGKGAVNFHDGPLPRHAGLNAPVWALLEGETEHGITWHLIEGGVDEGDILEQRLFPIQPGGSENHF